MNSMFAHTELSLSYLNLPNFTWLFYPHLSENLDRWSESFLFLTLVPSHDLIHINAFYKKVIRDNKNKTLRKAASQYRIMCPYVVSTNWLVFFLNFSLKLTSQNLVCAKYLYNVFVQIYQKDMIVNTLLSWKEAYIWYICVRVCVYVCVSVCVCSKYIWHYVI